VTPLSLEQPKTYVAMRLDDNDYEFDGPYDEEYACSTFESVVTAMAKTDFNTIVVCELNKGYLVGVRDYSGVVVPAGSCVCEICHIHRAFDDTVKPLTKNKKKVKEAA